LVVRDLWRVANSGGSGSSWKGMEEEEGKNMKIIVAQEGSVYIDLIEGEMMEGVVSSEKEETSGDKVDFGFGTIDDPLSVREGGAEEEENASQQQTDFPSSLLLLIPLRLGVTSLNPSYHINLSKFFSLPGCAGFVGGTPRFALWFYGSNGGKVYGLDPHVVQGSGCGDGNGGVKITDQHIKSLQCRSGKEALISSLDPSLALAFYCRDRTEWNELVGRLREEGGICDLKGGGKGNAPLFSLLDRAPDYEADMGVMEDLMGGEIGGGGGGEDGDEEDDDDFVFI